MFKKRERKNKSLEILSNQNNVDPDPEESEFLHNKREREEETKRHKKPNFTTRDQNELDKKYNEEMMEELNFKSTLTLHNVNTAARHTEEHTEEDKDGLALAEKNMRISKEILEGNADDKTYRGKKGYVIYAEKSERDKEKHKFTGSLGPIRAPTNIRLTTRVDYAPGVCKDYKETGRCGFGDGCIFMHDRGDYKLGWELDLEWEAQKRKENQRKMQGLDSSSEESDYEIHEDDELPKVCQICNGLYNNPVVTKCQHYFCESCALSHYGKSSVCFVCRKPTNGIFNNADYIFKRLAQLEKRKGKKNKKNKAIQLDHNHDEHECGHDSDAGGVDRLYSDSKTVLTRDLLDEYEDEEAVEQNRVPRKKKKNTFKVQNGWLPPSDYRSYQ